MKPHFMLRDGYWQSSDATAAYAVAIAGITVFCDSAFRTGEARARALAKSRDTHRLYQVLSYLRLEAATHDVVLHLLTGQPSSERFTPQVAALIKELDPQRWPVPTARKPAGART